MVTEKLPVPRLLGLGAADVLIKLIAIVIKLHF